MRFFVCQIWASVQRVSVLLLRQVIVASSPVTLSQKVDIVDGSFVYQMLTYFLVRLEVVGKHWKRPTAHTHIHQKERFSCIRHW